VLFRELYYHPRARFGEYLMSRVLVKKLYDAGKLTRDELLSMSDATLEARLNEAYGEFRVLRMFSMASEVCSFKTHEEAETFRYALTQAGHTFVLVENHLNSVKTGAHFLVQTRRGPKPLSEAYPGDARELHEMANMFPAVHVYYLKEESCEDKKDIASVLA
jgi:hypothetical protein